MVRIAQASEVGTDLRAVRGMLTSDRIGRLIGDRWTASFSTSTSAVGNDGRVPAVLS
jgi:hypothetical protein